MRNDMTQEEFNFYTIKRQGPFALQFIQNQDQYSCEVAVNMDPLALQFVQPKYKTIKMCFDAVMKNGLAIRFVPEEMKTKDLCRLAALQNIQAIEFIPEEYRTDELYFECCARNINNIEFVLDEELREKLYLDTIVSKVSILNIPEYLRTNKIYIKAAKYNSYMLDFVDFSKVEQEDYIDIIRQDGLAIQFVPKEYRTKDICYIAVEQNGYAIQFVPEQYQEEELHLIAIRGNVDALRFIKNQTEKIQLEAVKQDINLIKIIVNPTEEVSLFVVDKKPGHIRYINKRCQTQKICELAFYKQYNSKRKSKMKTFAKYIDDRFKTFDMCEKLVDLHYENIEYIPEHIYTQEFVDYIIDKYKHNKDFTLIAIINIPSEFISYDNYKHFLNMNTYSFKFIPEKYLTPEIEDICIDKLKYLKGKNKSIRNIWIHTFQKSERVLLFLLDINPMYILDIEPEYQTVEICWKAINKNIKAISGIAKPTKAMLSYVLNHKLYYSTIGTNILKNNPDIDDEIINRLIAENPNNIKYVGKTEDRYVQVLKIKPTFMKSIPAKDITDKIIATNVDNILNSFKVDDKQKISILNILLEELQKEDKNG